jgi:regulator of PEP synthase PpsR (kinase-PPPase family)
MEYKKNILVVSDATGTTAEMVLRAALTQFKAQDISIKRVPNVRDNKSVNEVVKLARETNGIIVHTFVSSELREKIINLGTKYGVTTIDIMGPLLTRLTNFLESTPTVIPGLFHLSENYLRRIESIDFTVKHDDGQDPNGLIRADLILIGISRTLKTLYSVSISNQMGWKIANVPISPGVEIPRQLFKVDPNKIVGLTISPEKLFEIRESRLRRSGWDGPMGYDDYNQICKEVELSNQIFAQSGWVTVDVTGKSIEEVASDIINLVKIDKIPPF